MPAAHVNRLAGFACGSTTISWTAHQFTPFELPKSFGKIYAALGL